MKAIYLLLIIFAAVILSCKTTKPAAEAATVTVQQPEQPVKTTNFSDASTWIIGYFKVNRLYEDPYSTWFVKGFDEYTADNGTVTKLKDLNMEGISVKIVLGTWCPDSRREVPKFMRVMKEIGFPADRIQLIGVDNSKFSPIARYDELKIERVPTFIFYRNNIEAGRIIENPTASLEQDMLNILTRNEKQ